MTRPDLQPMTQCQSTVSERLPDLELITRKAIKTNNDVRENLLRL